MKLNITCRNCGEILEADAALALDSQILTIRVYECKCSRRTLRSYIQDRDKATGELAKMDGLYLAKCAECNELKNKIVCLSFGNDKLKGV